MGRTSLPSVVPRCAPSTERRSADGEDTWIEELGREIKAPTYPVFREENGNVTLNLDCCFHFYVFPNIFYWSLEDIC